MDPDLITSPQNATVKRIRKLRQRKFREVEGRFLVEGIAHVRQAVDHRAPIDTLLVAPDLLTSEGAWKTIEEQREAGTRTMFLGREAFESIVVRDHPSGLAAVVEMQERPLTSMVAEPNSVFVAVLDVGNPGNLGSIIRTVDAVGGAGVVVVGESTDVFHPQSVKASMGTIFSVPFHRASDVDELFAWCLMEQVEVITTSVHAPTLLWEAGLDTPCLFLFGSETQGLPPEVLGRGSVAVNLPMAGSASSLNLSVAVGVMLYEMRRRAVKP
ncbi:MAG: methyltransferase, TrmH family [Actinomycetota bacterium]|jgi:TrmH family RNA methyltransferase|nr:methyltransferase, TrmH family [Actinomycetota bacterium]